MRGLGAGSIQTCVTSPPYFGLRDYGHEGQIGLEETPDAYVAKLVEVFREVHRVLRDDGTLWLNLGDSYAGNGGRGAQAGEMKNRAHGLQARSARTRPVGDLKEKDLIGIPWMVAFALRADGWYLRQGIVWHKPNPMPESVTDRFTKAHEDLFLLTKSSRYYFDHEAVKEEAKTKPGASWAERKEAGATRGNVAFGDNVGAGTQRGVFGNNVSHNLGAANGKRNRRSVWTVTTRPYKGAHFATFPPALIEPCILAGSRPGDMVLDPFGGSGTTAGVALKYGRHAMLCELNQEYADLIPARVDSIVNSK